MGKMRELETKLQRRPELGKWFVDILPTSTEQDIFLGPDHLFYVDLEPSPWPRFNVAWADDDAVLRFLVMLKAA